MKRDGNDPEAPSHPTETNAKADRSAGPSVLRAWRDKRETFPPPPESFGESSLQRPVVREATRATSTDIVTEPARILSVVDALARHRSRGRWQFADGRSCPALLIGYRDGMLHWLVEGGQGLPPVVTEVSGLNSMFQFQLVSGTRMEREAVGGSAGAGGAGPTLGVAEMQALLEADGALPEGEALGEAVVVATPIPSRILRMRRRWQRRAHISIPLRFEARGNMGSGRVRDVSYHGLSFELESTAEPVPVDAELDVIVGEGSDATEARIKITALRMDVSGALVYSGQLVRSRSGDGTRHWAELVTNVLHPHTYAGSGWLDAQWRLFEASGYFSLSDKTPEDFAAWRYCFEDFSRRLDKAPHLGCHVVWPLPEENKVAATLSALKVYKGAWLGFQMAKVSGAAGGFSGREILLGIHLRAYEHLQQDPALEWVIGYLQVKRAWSALVHYELPKRYVAQGLASVTRFRVLEVLTEESPFAEYTTAVRAVKVSTANAEECRLLAASIARMRPPAYCDALDLTEERLDMASNRDAWNRAGLVRDRTVLVARVEGRVVAGAVVEMAEDGAHLFSLLDLVRLYPIDSDGEAYFAHLADGAREWYASHGKSRFVCLLEDGAMLPTEIEDRLSDLGEADMTILSAQRLPELLEHVYELTAPRARGEEK